MSLRRQAAAGVRWTGFAFVFNTVLRLVVFAILARILKPADFGLVASLTALIAILQAFGDLGLGTAIIQRREVDDEQLSSLFWLSQISGIAVSIGLWLSAPVLASLYNEPQLEPLVAIVALRFVLVPAGVPFAAVLQRELAFRRLTTIQVIASLVGGSVSVVSAYLEQGAYSLVWGELAATATNSTLMLMAGWSRWRPTLRLRRDDLRGYVRFMAYQVGERSLTQFAMNLDYILVALVLGPTALGIYSMAFEIASLPTRTINPVFTRVALPVFARIQDNNRPFSHAYIELTRMLALIQFPILVGIGVLAPRLVPAFLGSGWEDAVPLTQILSGLGAFRVLCNPAGSAFLAKGRVDIGFAWALFTATLSGVVFSVLVPYGLTVVASGWVILIALYWSLLTLALNRLIALPVGPYLHSLARPAAIATVLLGMLLSADRLATSLALGKVAALAFLACAGLAITAALIWILEQAFVVRQLKALFPPSEPT